MKIEKLGEKLKDYTRDIGGRIRNGGRMGNGREMTENIFYYICTNFKI